jgi:protein-tyrosine phosphatase
MLEQSYMDNVTAQQANNQQERRLSFSGAKNFRDLGGYQAADGRTVRWGLLYRSDSLHKLTGADLRYLSTLHLDRIIDFRSTYEKNLEPDRIPEELKPRLVHIPILDSSTGLFQHSRDEFVKIIPAIDAAEFMVNTNIELVTRFAGEMRQFIDILLSSNGGSVLFHCAAGKDRTGFAAALFLRLMGVPQDVVLDDYLLTNQYFLSSYRWTLRVLRLVRGRRFAKSVREFMIAEPAYLGSAFKVIDETYGSFERYVSDGLGLTSTDIVHLQALYLEK